MLQGESRVEEAASLFMSLQVLHQEPERLGKS